MAGRPPPPLEIVPYDRTWPARFEGERALLAHAVPEALSVDHIGSTSVPGLSAKPTLDILLVVPVVSGALERAEQLSAVGYLYRPGAFPEDADHLFFRKVVDGRRLAHLHVLSSASPKPAEYRLFREFLRDSPMAASTYEEAKLALAEAVRYDRAAYVAAKHHIVEELLNGARTWQCGRR